MGSRHLALTAVRSQPVLEQQYSSATYPIPYSWWLPVLAHKRRVSRDFRLDSCCARRWSASIQLLLLLLLLLLRMFELLNSPDASPLLPLLPQQCFPLPDVVLCIRGRGAEQRN